MPEGDMSTESPWGPRKVRNSWRKGAEALPYLVSVLHAHIREDHSDKLAHVYRSTSLTCSAGKLQTSKSVVIDGGTCREACSS